ncbi:hypothetical protein [uncultured Aquimarina sp.]|uniref:hypothetical protein n=1 Tax=uncultured Aquimarina sp. TaxID=575652 RepID=UPI002620D4B7|nr:hypothetical protein [uncultured Aquimarina sp.]
MLKSLLELKNVSNLSKLEQRSINGGTPLIPFHCCGLPHYECDRNIGCQWEGSHCGFNVSHAVGLTGCSEEGQ